MQQKHIDMQIMMQDPNQIRDPTHCAFITTEQARIIVERQQSPQQLPPSNTMFDQYFNNVGGSLSNLSDYRV